MSSEKSHTFNDNNRHENNWLSMTLLFGNSRQSVIEQE